MNQSIYPADDAVRPQRLSRLPLVYALSYNRYHARLFEQAQALIRVCSGG